VVRDNVTPNVYVYDASFGGGGQFRVWNGTVGNLPGGLVPMGSAFWAKAHAASPAVSVPEVARVPNGTPEIPAATVLELQLDGTVGGDVLSTESFLAFDPAGADDFDVLDAYTFVPLSPDYLLLASRPASGPVRSSIDVRPMPAEGVSNVYSLDVESVSAGSPTPATLTMTWPTLATLPADLVVTMLDHETSATIDLRGQSSYEFTSNGLGPTSAPGTPSILPTGGDGRFTLTIRRTGVATEGGPSGTFALQPASPNPFRGATAIAYSLDAPAHVRLALYDALGRRVATLAEGERAAGGHTVALNGARLPAGVYVLRLEADGRQGRQVATTRIVHAE
jgi:hypothetical protein